MNGEVNGVFIYNGRPQNGATAQLWKITGFASYANSADEVENVASLVAEDIELAVNDETRFAVGDVIKITDEILRVTHIEVDLLYVIRGYRGTTPAIHAQNTQIDDETITEPAQDTSVPAGFQWDGDVTTGVAHGGDGAYRWTAVPEGEYYVSVTYDGHIAWLYASVETNDPTPEQILREDGDTIIRNADGVTRLPGGANGQFYQMDADRPTWGAVGGLTKEFFIPATGIVNVIDLDAIGKHPGMLLDDANAEGSVGFYVPNDYTAITDAVLVLVWDALYNNTDLDFYSEYGAIGEAYNNHSDSDEAATPSFVADELTEFDVSGLLGAIAIGDHVGVSVKLSTDPGGALYFLGLRFRYT